MGPISSRRPFLFLVCISHAEKASTPSGAASSGEAALQQQLSRQQEQLEALQKQCLSFSFYCFHTVSKSLECDVSIISHVVDAAIESL